MAYLVLDVETTTLNKGNPFDPRNRLCVVSWRTKDACGLYKIEYDEEPYGASLAALQHLINIHEVLVVFNGKFDLHWLRKYGIQFCDKRIWDVQLAYYILSRQTKKLPSLDAVAEALGFGQKLDQIKKYWESGLDTPQIPFGELSEYALQDVKLTEDCYKALSAQLDALPDMRRLFTVSCADLLVLEEMEWNGMFYAVTESLEEAQCIKEQMEQIEERLIDILDHDYAIDINWNSPKQVSAILYGGEVEFAYKEKYLFNYKDGRVAEKERNATRFVSFPRLVEPNEKHKSEDGKTWSTAEPVIKHLKATGKAKRLINLLLELSKLEKLHGTYLTGIPAIMTKHQWTDYIHGQLNQTIAKTGRLSSSNPNMQNMPSDVDRFFVSRYGDEGLVVQFDVKGLEVICAAYLSQDKTLIKELSEGQDIHSNNQEAFKLHDRLAAKRFMFKMIYGGTAAGFANDADFLDLKMNVKRWQEVIDAFYQKYYGIQEWHKQLIGGILRSRRYKIPSGREFDFSEAMTKPEWYYIPKFKNYPVQGFGADIVMVARVSLFKRLKAAELPALLVNTIHDSIILDIKKDTWYNISMMVNKVFEDLPTNIKNIWGITLGLEVRVEASVLTTGEDIK